MVRNRHATTIMTSRSADFPCDKRFVSVTSAVNRHRHQQTRNSLSGRTRGRRGQLQRPLAALENNRPDEAITQIKSVIAQLPEQPAVWRDLPVACRTQVAPSGSGDDVVIEFDMPDVPLPDGWIRDFVIHKVGWDKDVDLNTWHGQTARPLPLQSSPCKLPQPYASTPDTERTKYLKSIRREMR